MSKVDLLSSNPQHSYNTRLSNLNYLKVNLKIEKISTILLYYNMLY